MLFLVLELSDCLVHVHLLAVLEGDDECVLKLRSNLSLRAEHLVIVGAFAIRIVVKPLFLIVAYR